MFMEKDDYKGAYIAVIMKLLDNLLENKDPVIYEMVLKLTIS